MQATLFWEMNDQSIILYGLQKQEMTYINVKLIYFIRNIFLAFSTELLKFKKQFQQK